MLDQGLADELTSRRVRAPLFKSLGFGLERVDMPFTSPFGWVLLIAAVAAGWLLGAATGSAGMKWRKRYREREVIIAKYRREMEKALVKARERIRQLEGEREGVSETPPEA